MHNCQCGQRTVFTGACHYNCDGTIICTQPGLRDFSDSPIQISLTLDLTLREFANTNSENIQRPGGLGLKGRNFETINLFITTQVVTEAAWEPGLLVVTDANCFTALHCFLSASLQVFCPNSSWLRYLGSSLQSLVGTINGPVKILTCPFTLCGHKSLFLSDEFPPERSDKWKIVANIEFILSY